MKSLEKLIEKKKADKPLDENYKNAKMSSLASLRGEMMKMMKDDMVNGHSGHGVKKVEVASDDPAGLAEGLDKAKEMVSPEDDSFGDNGMSEAHDNGEMGETLGDEHSEGELSDDEIDQLMHLLAKMKSDKKGF